MGMRNAPTTPRARVRFGTRLRHCTLRPRSDSKLSGLWSSVPAPTEYVLKTWARALPEHAALIQKLSKEGSMDYFIPQHDSCPDRAGDERELIETAARRVTARVLAASRAG